MSTFVESIGWSPKFPESFSENTTTVEIKQKTITIWLTITTFGKIGKNYLSFDQPDSKTILIRN